jgi:hypothetical protein
MIRNQAIGEYKGIRAGEKCREVQYFGRGSGRHSSAHSDVAGLPPEPGAVETDAAEAVPSGIAGGESEENGGEAAQVWFG